VTRGWVVKTTNPRALVLAALLAGVVGGTAVIKPWEGKENVGYLDVVNVPTDCWGNTQGAKVGVYRTDAECEALLAEDIRDTVHGLSRCVTREVQPHEAAALIAWAYNVGVPRACSSTLVKELNRGEPADLWCDELLRWDFAGGRRIKGLTNRRRAEHAVCEGRAP
jgi:lysozyme